MAISYKQNDSRRQTSFGAVYVDEFESTRTRFQDIFAETAAALASTGFSKLYWTGAGTNGTQAIIAGGSMQLDTSATGSSTSTLDFNATGYDPTVAAPSIETKVAGSDLTNCKFEFGFYASANDYLLFRFDSAVSATNLYIASKNNGGTEVTMDTGIALTAATSNKFRMDILTNMTARLYVDDKEILFFTGTNRSLTTYKVHFYIDNKAAAVSKKLTIGYVELSANK